MHRDIVERLKHQRKHEDLLQSFPVVALIGAPQIGKTTLAQMLPGRRKAPTRFLDLESPSDAIRLSDPFLALEPLRGLVVLDGIR